MRNSPIDILVIGCGIALGVVLVHALTQGASALAQLLALLIAGFVLFCAQLALLLRRARGSRPPEQPDQAHLSLRSLRRRARNPFARELTRDWVGLEEHSLDRDPAAPLVSDALDELWSEPHAPSRKPAVKQPDDSYRQ